MKLQINSELVSSSANGPGNRYVIWTQGCELNCDGCFNPESHDINNGFEIDVDELYQNVISIKQNEGVSISGGEPLLQMEPLLELLNKIKKETNLSTLIFTGYTFSEIEVDKELSKILELTDILILGRYENSKPSEHPLLGSSNQEIIFLTDRYSMKDISNIACEVIIDDKGNIKITGIEILKTK
ncbi:MAG: 4Fe-4S single cluster domain-containing protein [Candidatus Delongbacteria bacterium]|jgi:anaerobic ribonucleoside-triphosphate reductase activating protein|nr:4Fe-4S single cluster domain-containing protein [Candidatus Delongbacteria bacterium]